jgi:MoCo/4Fe-4S cofactor protein with predicted Tat translocation signal
MPSNETTDRKIMDKKVIDISNEIVNSDASNDASADAGAENNTDPNYWRSFRELYNDPEFNKLKAREFADGALDKPDVNDMSRFSRRKFLALLSASAAVAATGCSNYRDQGVLLPYNKKPEEVSVGIPTYYASTCTGCEHACGMIIKTIEGRPIKVDGNPDHPVSKGKICAIGQASVMNLYDPERLKNPVERPDKINSNEIPWASADEKIIGQLKAAASSGKEIAVISNTINSPSLKKALDEFKTAYPTAKVYSFELFDDSTRRSAWEKSYGTPNLPIVQLDKAKVILALESDFLGNEGNKIENSMMYVKNRDAYDGEFNRLYAVEGNASITGMNADYRIILRTDAIEEFVYALMIEIIGKEKISGFSTDSAAMSRLQKHDMSNFISKYGITKETVDHLISDLKKNQGASYVLAGSSLPESTHIAVNLLNEALGNTALHAKDQSHVTQIPLSPKTDWDALITSMKGGKVGAVIHFDSNPAFVLPADYRYSEALKSVLLVVSLSEQINESTAVSNFVLPISSMFESWGDYQTRNTFYSLQQPVIAPLYNTRQKEEIILVWTAGNKDAYNKDIYRNYIQANWKTTVLAAQSTDALFKTAWNAGLNDGVVKVSSVSSAGTTDTTPLQQGFKPEAFVTSTNIMTAGSNFVLLLTQNGNLGDGRFANNGWLQELPKPLSRVVWDNYAAISVQTAKAMQLESSDLVKITTPAGALEMPVFIQPGVAEGVIAVQLGYGRTECGIVGKDVGFNANSLVTKNAKLSPWLYDNVTIEKVGGTHEIVSTVEHYNIEDPLLKDIQFKRHIIQEGTYLQYKADPEFLKKRHGDAEHESINKQYKHTGTKWGMVIDLNKCIGCGECVVACNVENNIPIVGKDQVKMSREMQWLRIDRYYFGTPENPGTSFQPMLCQHCDFAPCENVCPVAATTHSTDGINGMAYNRCVGTRYCSNNCPYKVRRFNYYNFRDRFRDSIQQEESFSLMANPEVTVRSRGVMEKCTFCLQRIMEERAHAIKDNRQVIGSNVKTACQEACVTSAIVFGDQNAEDSELYKLTNSDLGYTVLEEIKVKPNVTYIAKLRNVYETENTEAKH